MVIKAEQFVEEKEPPGRGLILEHHGVPSSSRRLQRFVDPLATDIVAAYRGVHPSTVEPLAKHKRIGAASGIRDASNVVIARDSETGDFAGLFAYTRHTREDDPVFVGSIHLEGCPIPLNQEERRRVEMGLRVLKDESLFIETNELVVPKERRGMGVSEHMRTSVYNDQAKALGKTYVILLGDMKDASPVGQREKTGGVTYWAGQFMGADSDKLPFNLTPTEFQALAWATFNAYRQSHGISYRDSYMDSYGIVTGGDIFELPVRLPKQYFSGNIIAGLEILKEREEASGKLCSSMGITILPLYY